MEILGRGDVYHIYSDVIELQNACMYLNIFIALPNGHLVFLQLALGRLCCLYHLDKRTLMNNGRVSLPDSRVINVVLPAWRIQCVAAGQSAG